MNSDQYPFTEDGDVNNDGQPDFPGGDPIGGTNIVEPGPVYAQPSGPEPTPAPAIQPQGAPQMTGYGTQTIDYTGTYPGNPDRVLRQAIGVDDYGNAIHAPVTGSLWDLTMAALGNPSHQTGPGWTQPTPTPAAGMPGTSGYSAPSPSGPAAMAAGQGWYIDSHGRFISDNMGANARANTTYDAYGLGPGTIMDNGRPGNQTAQRTYGDLTANGKQFDPSGYGLTSPAVNPIGNYNPHWYDTPQQTYGNPSPVGVGTNAAGSGSVGVGAGGGNGPGGTGTLSPTERVVTHNGVAIAVRDANGYLAPEAWSSIDNIINNAQRGDPFAIDKVRALAQAGAGDASLRAQTVLGGIPGGGINGNDAFLNGANFEEWRRNHNTEINAGGGKGIYASNGPGTTDMAAIAGGNRANDQVYGDVDAIKHMLEATGRKFQDIDHYGNLVFTNKDGQTAHIPWWEAESQLAKLAADYTNTTGQPPPSRNPRGQNPRGQTPQTPNVPWGSARPDAAVAVGQGIADATRPTLLGNAGPEPLNIGSWGDLYPSQPPAAPGGYVDQDANPYPSQPPAAPGGYVDQDANPYNRPVNSAPMINDATYVTGQMPGTSAGVLPRQVPTRPPGYTYP